MLHHVVSRLDDGLCESEEAAYHHHRPTLVAEEEASRPHPLTWEVEEEVFDPSEFEEPELYESMRILKGLENIRKKLQKKKYFLDAKKSIQKEKRMDKDKIKTKIKRPCLDLEKMLKVREYSS